MEGFFLRKFVGFTLVTTLQKMRKTFWFPLLEIVLSVHRWCAHVPLLTSCKCFSKSYYRCKSIISLKFHQSLIYTENNQNVTCRHIVGLCGPPGAGKSTVASEVARRVNKLWPQRSSCFDSQVESPDVAIVLPMDGFHLYRHQLDAMKVSS